VSWIDSQPAGDSVPTKHDYDLLVVGAGSGGVRRRASLPRTGPRVAVIEEHRVGGTWSSRGCVPKKLLVCTARTFAEDLVDARRFGWNVGMRPFDWPTLRDNVLAEVSRLSGIYTETLTSHDVDTVSGRAVVTGPNSVRVGDRVLTAATILIATGARPQVPDVPGAQHAITSNEAFHLDAVPKRIVIAGGGYIANEFAGIFHQFGAEVTLLNRSDQILRNYDEQIRDRLLQISLTKGIRFLFNRKLKGITRSEHGTLTLDLEGAQPLQCDALMFATGRVPNTDGWGSSRPA
jgi:glutathione reductase (NADPH)